MCGTGIILDAQIEMVMCNNATFGGICRPEAEIIKTITGGRLK